MVNGSGPFAVAQPDTALYFQAARRIVEGHPFSYSAGEAACTGTTSVLYPFVLALPYALGFTGDRLATAGFGLNACFYLLFLAGWGYAIWRMFPDAARRYTAGVVLALLGQVAFCAMSQSDIGMWLAASGGLAAALETGNPWLYGVALVVVPWVRPEGMVCVIAYLLIISAFALWGPSSRKPGRAAWLVGALGVLSVAGVFALNYALTGEMQFSSVAGKGHFKLYGFAEGVHRTVCDLMSILQALVFGEPESTPRSLYFPPLIGAALMWVGAFAHDWRRVGVERGLVMLLAAGGGVLTVAQSGWQNTNMDRYLAWTLPVLAILLAEGVVALGGYLARKGRVAWLAWLVPLGFMAGAAVEFQFCFNLTSGASEKLTDFARHLEQALPPGASVGTIGNCGLAYNLGDRRLAHLAGIYSPEFPAKDVDSNLEALKWRRDLRFDYWVVDGDDVLAKGFMALQGKQVLVGPNGIDVRKANWTAFDRAAIPQVELPAGVVPYFHVDVGSQVEERQAGYELGMRYHQKPFPVFQRVDALGSGQAFDCARVVVGEDSMLVPLKPGQDCTVVLRTLPAARVAAPTRLGTAPLRDFHFESPLKLSVEVDGVAAGTYELEFAAHGFTDVAFTLPGKLLVNPVSRIAFRGDHIACCYWFCQ